MKWRHRNLAYNRLNTYTVKVVISKHCLLLISFNCEVLNNWSQVISYKDKKVDFLIQEEKTSPHMELRLLHCKINYMNVPFFLILSFL